MVTIPTVDLPDWRVAELNREAWSRRGTARQWSPLVIALAQEVATGGMPGAAHAFLRQLGRRMARSTPLPHVETLEAMQDAINAVWAEIDWGWVRLLVREDGIRIIHGAWPELSAPDDGETWPGVAAAILEGIYAAWFEAQGSTLERTKTIGPRAGALEFLHGA
jgi:hypothetical protein